MFLCHGLLCDRTAAVWMRGKPWCVPCSIKRFGFTTSALETAEAVAPEAAPEPGPVFTPRGPDPAPLFDDQLVALLDERGWDLLDAEWACVSALEEGTTT